MDKIADILLAEDNPADVMLFGEAIESTGWKCRLHVVRDGSEALDSLLHGKAEEQPLRPDVILLDHNLPRRSGLEVYAEIKKDRLLAGIPLIILSGGELERSTALTAGLPADRYMVKPATYAGYIEVARRIEAIWRESMQSPHPA